MAQEGKKLAQIGDITPANLQQLRVLNAATLPVRYSDKFYNDLLNIYSHDYLKFAFANGFVVGGICARIEDHPDIPEKKRLYIMTLNVLAAYRRKGIGKGILNFAFLALMLTFCALQLLTCFSTFSAELKKMKR